MNLPSPAQSYDVGNEANARRQIEQEDKRNRKAGADVEIDKEKLILRSPNGSRWSIVVADDGTLSSTAL